MEYIWCYSKQIIKCSINKIITIELKINYIKSNEENIRIGITQQNDYKTGNELPSDLDGLDASGKIVKYKTNFRSTGYKSGDIVKIAMFCDEKKSKEKSGIIQFFINNEYSIQIINRDITKEYLLAITLAHGPTSITLIKIDNINKRYLNIKEIENIILLETE